MPLSPHFRWRQPESLNMVNIPLRCTYNRSSLKFVNCRLPSVEENYRALALRFPETGACTGGSSERRNGETGRLLKYVGLSSSESVSSAYTNVSLPTSFLVAHPSLFLISLFYAECIVAQSRLSQLESLLQQHHLNRKFIKTTGSDRAVLA
jgi:hypothetical protein